MVVQALLQASKAALPEFEFAALIRPCPDQVFLKVSASIR